MAAVLWWDPDVSFEHSSSTDAAPCRSEVPCPPSTKETRRRERTVTLYLPRSLQRRHWVRPWALSRHKRILDIVSASALLTVFAPLMIVIAIAIKLHSPGPALFHQHRTGLGGRRFRMYKFRSMVPDAERLKDSFRALNHHGPNSPDFKIRKDPRVTSLGKVLRRSSLDELPNLINVLRGEMSMVGPRPTSFGVEKYSENHLVRLTVPPGLTGLWQISGRSDIEFDDRVKLDCRYIQDQSFLLDLRIILLTPLRVFNGRGAC